MIEFHVKNHVEKIEVSADLESNKHETDRGHGHYMGKGQGSFPKLQDMDMADIYICLNFRIKTSHI